MSLFSDSSGSLNPARFPSAPSDLSAASSGDRERVLPAELDRFLISGNDIESFWNPHGKRERQSTTASTSRSNDGSTSPKSAARSGSSSPPSSALGSFAGSSDSEASESEGQVDAGGFYTSIATAIKYFVHTFFDAVTHELSPNRNNASLTILGARPKPVTDGAYFVTLEALKRHCDDAIGRATLRDMVLFGLSFFYLKDHALPRRSADTEDGHKMNIEHGKIKKVEQMVMEATSSPSLAALAEADTHQKVDQQPSVIPTLLHSVLPTVFLCVHNDRYSGSYGFKASVPYLHLHVTNQKRYPEFVPTARPWLGPADFGYQGAWEEHGAACVPGMVAIANNTHTYSDINTEFTNALEDVATRLWHLIPPHHDTSIDFLDQERTPAEQEEIVFT
ncbi:unnamed protein product [Amoebophrya sp. A25]|nr:unnamed protein product [Amoebophrya sp. A25]|eukprot:GSA25T00024836001.1